MGNLPFRRVCKKLGVDITCGEMAVTQTLAQGQQGEWSLMRRHPSEDVFGVQIAASNAELAGHTAQIIEQFCNVDFVDLNVGCPIDLICKRGAGSALADRPRRFEAIVRTMDSILSWCVCLSVHRCARDRRLTWCASAAR